MPRPTSVSVTGVGTSNPILLDVFGSPNVSLQAVVSGTATYTIQQTLDNVRDNGAAAATWFDHPDTALVGATASKQGNYAYVPTATRINLTSGTGTVTLTAVQAG